MAFDMKDYVDVAERIAEFSAKYPEGSLQSDLTPLYKDDVLVGWLCRAYAYRSASDERPGVGHAVEPVPGKTPYTRDSEAMNAETSAWGRAIIALGFKTKKIASKQEAEARQDAAEGTAAPAGRGKRKEAPNGSESPAAGTFASEAQRKRLFAIAKENSVDTPTLKVILEQITGQGSTAQIPRDQYDKVCVAVQTYQLATSLAGGDDLPFE
jgi:hypothetical protein